MNATVEIPQVNYSIVFDFERNFPSLDKYEWMHNNWRLSFVYSAIYLVLIFAGRKFMENRPRYELRTPLFLWSASLAVFSICGACRFLPEMYVVLRDFGFYHSCCVASFYEYNMVSAFWTWTFAHSKVLELGDTVFIVLRKQPLLFLHWYHHITVLAYVWFSCHVHTASGRWFITMNYTVHSMMYSYYALKALKFRIPKPVSIFITISQLMQMIVGLYVNIWVYQTKTSGKLCNVSYDNIKVSLLMYFSYFLLFLNFFFKTYVDKKSGRDDSIKKTN